ncbi:hypothetical protein [Streptomyces sp. NPDC048442]|uniref:hypothetical protein n=1 Tax=Streptomyces sp. NPDC048442 TaxID=3154823 RepID=UPI003440BA94
MEIPNWFVWIFLGPAVMQALALVPVTRRLRRADSAARSKARLDLLETVATLLFVVGLLLCLSVTESWFWLTFVGFALMGAVYVTKGVHRLRTRRPTA